MNEVPEDADNNVSRKCIDTAALGSVDAFATDAFLPLA
jgi:hypothetical protein